jgi:diadenosine tetraphosphate (Ap4A) HIT family hydrolase
MERLNAKELTVVVNYGTAQKIKHYHMHLLPNFGTRAERNIEDVYKELL